MSLSPQISDLLELPLAPELRRVATVFVQLQEARHAADYDFAVSFNRPSVLLTIARVQRAFDDFASVKRDDNTRIFLVDLLLRGKWDRT